MTLTRRSFLRNFALTLTALSSSWIVGRERLNPKGETHTLSLHMDRAFIGHDDTLWAYCPSGVIGGACAIAALSDTEVRAHYPYL
jgi:hypothetical protein